MSLEEKELDIIINRIKSDLIPVPDELEDKINKWVVAKKHSKKKKRFRNFSIGAVAASILLVSFILSPTARTYAKDIPIVSMAVVWFEELLIEYKGIETAEKNNYKPFKPHSFSAGNYELEMDHLFLEDEQLFFTLLVKGGDIADSVYKEESGMLMMDNYPEINIESESFARNPNSVEGAGASMGIQRISGKYYIMAKYTLYIDPNTVHEFIKNDGNTLSFSVEIDGNKANVDIPLSNTKIQLGKHFVQNEKIELQNSEAPFTVQKLVVYPTRMELELTGGSQDAFLKMVSNIYLQDEKGNKYSLRVLQVNSDSYKLESLSTIYFDEKVKELTLNVGINKGVQLNITEE